MYSIEFYVTIYYRNDEDNHAPFEEKYWHSCYNACFGHNVLGG